MFTPDMRFKKDFTVSSFDVDAKKQASPQSILRYMQEMAVLHAEKLGLGFDDMMKENRAWVLTQLLLHIERYPHFHENITIITWSNGPDGRFALRDFEIYDEKDRRIGAASSTWLVVDIGEKTICRLDNYFGGYDYKNITYALDRKPARIKPFDEADKKREVFTRYSDLDMNGHVNNVRYVDHVLDIFPRSFRMEKDIAEIEMNFLKEAREHEELINLLRIEKEGQEYLHCLFNQSSQTASFTARTSWV
jgi:acyl-ACP thioesterase